MKRTRGPESSAQPSSKETAIPIIRPGITADGFRTAVRDYTVPSVVEELAANAYDADARVCVVLLDSANLKLYVVDDGIGFATDAARAVAILGAGDKRDIPISKANRHYLGSYGYGLKSTLNVASKLTIHSLSSDGLHEADVDWNQLDKALDLHFPGFPLAIKKTRGSQHTGTVISLALRSPKNKKDLEVFGRALQNLPTDGGRFKCYYGDYATVANKLQPDIKQLATIQKTAAALAKQNLLTLAESSRQADLQDCKKIEYKDKEDKDVTATIYFAGWEQGSVKRLKKGLRGIYVRIHGRLLKQSFTGREYTQPISKWVKFESALRVELSIPWLRDQITLSREGLRFSNEKIEKDFQLALRRAVSSFIQPELKNLDKKKQTARKRQSTQRRELARKRAKSDAGVIVKSVKSGFRFIPECDAELALILAHDQVIKKVDASYQLIDYNDQGSFDCMIWDRRRAAIVNTELEPDLMAFLSHKDRTGIELIITWTLGKWRVGARKRTIQGELELMAKTEGAKSKGRYTLAEYPSARSKSPRAHYDVVVLEELLA